MDIVNIATFLLIQVCMTKTSGGCLSYANDIYQSGIELYKGHLH